MLFKSLTQDFPLLAAVSSILIAEFLTDQSRMQQELIANESWHL